MSWRALQSNVWDASGVVSELGTLYYMLNNRACAQLWMRSRNQSRLLAIWILLAELFPQIESSVTAWQLPQALPEKLHHFINITNATEEDLQIWKSFCFIWNFNMPSFSLSRQHHLWEQLPGEAVLSCLEMAGKVNSHIYHLFSPSVCSSQHLKGQRKIILLVQLLGLKANNKKSRVG